MITKVATNFNSLFDEQISVFTPSDLLSLVTPLQGEERAEDYVFCVMGLNKHRDLTYYGVIVAGTSAEVETDLANVFRHIGKSEIPNIVISRIGREVEVKDIDNRIYSASKEVLIEYLICGEQSHYSLKRGGTILN